MAPPTWTMTARWVLPVDGPLLENGTVTIAGEHLAAIEATGTRQADIDLGNAAIIPGLVNTHTHLDLSGLRGKVPPSADFTDWLRGVIRHRRGQTRDRLEEDIAAGIAECRRFGSTLVGDISAEGYSWQALSAAPFRSVVFHELLGLSVNRAEEAWQRLGSWLSETARIHEHCRVGISPHAPYSVRSSLFSASAEQGVVCSTHLAETLEELELLADHRGPFVPFLQELAAWSPDGLVQSPENVLELTRGPNSVLYVHGNYLPSDVHIPANGTIVYCPRTHAAFGHPPHPFRAFLQRGIRVALGTDSLASNPDLDVLAEARFIHQCHPDVSGPTLLRMATLSGAEALGWADVTGSLKVGKSADLVVVPLPERDGDPHELLFAPGASARSVLWRGGWVYGDCDGPRRLAASS